MKQKYTIEIGDDKKELIIKEFAELDKDIMSLLCEETYEYEAIQSAMKNGRESLIVALRTPNMYPAKPYAERIADSIMALNDSGDKKSTEVLFDDFEFLTAARKRVKEIEEFEEEPAAEIDELLEEDFEEEEEFDAGKPAIDKIDSGLKIEEEDLTDFEEEI